MTGKTRGELPLGRPAPLSTREAVKWVAYFRVAEEYRERGEAKAAAVRDVKEQLG